MTTESVRTLFITKMSYPPIGGAPLRNWQNINMMKKFGPVGVFSVYDQDCSCESIDGLDLWHHYNIAKQPSTSVWIERGVRWLRHRGLSYFWVYLSTAARELDKLLTKFHPDLVIFEELWLYHYLPVVKRHPGRIIFDEHNVELPLYKETKCLDHSLIARARAKLHLPKIESTERDLIRQANQVWLCSEEDNRLLKDLYGSISNNYVVPNAVNLKFYDDVRLGRYFPPRELKETSRNLFFPGNFLYPPNAEAALLLINQIYPRLREAYPDCSLLLVGCGATRSMQQAAQRDPGIIVTGEVPDIRPYLADAEVMVVPLFKGGGTRFKILEAFAAGCPVVSTSKGAEGLRVKDGEHLLIRDEFEDIVDGVLQLWSDLSLRNKLIYSAYELVKSEYSWEAVSQKVEKAIRELF